MILKSLRIEGYRGFTKSQTLQFAAPDGQMGSGLTVLVGPNGAGKSSLIEALHFLRAPGREVALVEGQKNTATNGQVSIDYETDLGAFTLATVAGGAAGWTQMPTLSQTVPLYVVPPRRGIDPVFNLSAQSRDSYQINAPDFSSRRSPASAFAGRLAQIELNRGPFHSMLRRVLIEPPSWYLERNEQGQSFLKVTGVNSAHSSDGLGSGTVSVIHSVDAVHDSNPGDIIAIDEPELSLHPAAQRRLVEILLELAMDRQIIIATHSPFFVPIECLGAGMSIARIHRVAGSSIISQLAASTVAAIKPLLADRHNPHVLGLNAREVFFLEENVLLVEGQDDVLGYRRIFDVLGQQPSASFFGWGVGGSSKMFTIATVLRDLGLHRVFGVLDDGEEATVRGLSSAFPTYQFASIAARDIRTKPAREQQSEKVGLLDEHYDIRTEHREHTEALVRTISAYFGDERSPAQ
jgi:ABC-type lipoprotein export system ATPase subunit